MSSRNRVAQARSSQQQQQRRFIGTVVVLIAIAAVVAVTLTHIGGSSGPSSSQTQPVTVRGTALSPFDSSANDPAIGATIPALAGTGYDGKPVSIADDGKPKVLLFVAHWCPHCRREVPLLAGDLHAHPLPANLEMITVSTGVNASAPNYPPSKWLASVQWPTPVIADDSSSSAASAFGLTAYPYFVFVDAQNHVVARASGEMSLSDFRAHVSAIAQ